MTECASRLLVEALRLSEEERGELASRLIESLDPTVEENAVAAWNAELRQRLDELDQGTVSIVPWPEARRLIMKDSDGTSEPSVPSQGSGRGPRP